MGKYRKLPIIIDAIRLTESIKISTLEGVMIGNPGDWLITWVNGEQYPCKHEIFIKTYEPADEAADGRVVAWVKDTVAWLRWWWAQ